MPATLITDTGWLGAQLDAAGRRFRLDRRRTLGVLWWYSASSVLLGPVAESAVRGGAPVDPALANLTLYLHPDGRVLDARAERTLDPATSPVGPRLARALSDAIGVIAGTSGAPEPALWAITTDSLANRVLWAGGESRVAVELAAAAGDRLPVPRYVEVAGSTVVRRASCCLIYQAPAQDKCVSCPRQHPDVRHRRLHAALGGP